MEGRRAEAQARGRRPAPGRRARRPRHRRVRQPGHVEPEVVRLERSHGRERGGGCASIAGSHAGHAGRRRGVVFAHRVDGEDPRRARDARDADLRGVGGGREDVVEHHRGRADPVRARLPAALLFRRASRRHEGRVGPSADARVGRAHAHERGGGVPRAPPHLALPHEAPPGAFLPLRPRRRRPQAGRSRVQALAQGGRSRRVRRPLERDANHGGDPGHGRREAARDAVLRLSAAARRGGEVRGPRGRARRRRRRGGGLLLRRRLFPRGGARVRASARRRRVRLRLVPVSARFAQGLRVGVRRRRRAPRGSVLPPVRPRGELGAEEPRARGPPPGRERALLPAVLQAGPHAGRAPRPRPEPVLRHLLGLPVRPDPEVLRGGDAREGPRVSRREGRRLRPLGPGARRVRARDALRRRRRAGHGRGAHRGGLHRQLRGARVRGVRVRVRRVARAGRAQDGRGEPGGDAGLPAAVVPRRREGVRGRG